MAIVNVKEMAGDNYGKSVDGRTAVRVFSVLTDSPTTDTPLIVARSSLLPAVNAPHPQDFYLRAQSVDVRRIAPYYFEASVPYRTVSVIDSISDSENPLDSDARIRWTFSESEEQMDHDADGNPILNINGEPFDPPLTRPVRDPVLQITRNLPGFDIALATRYKDAVSSDSFLGTLPGQAHILGIEAEEIRQGDFSFFNLVASVGFRQGLTGLEDKAWYTRAPEMGYYIDDGGGKIVRATDDNGDPMIQPVLLKANGQRETDPANTVWKTVKRFPELPFADLQLI